MSNVNLRKHPKFEEIFISGPIEKAKIYTKNMTPGKRIYGEMLVDDNGEEFRLWNPYRSKLAAVIRQNPQINFIKKDSRTLYLGAASGTTVSHLSDITHDGIIYAIEFAERSIRQLVQNTSDRYNVIPILGDARSPHEYAKSIFTGIDFVYQDVAQPNQAEIAIKNCNYYLKKGGLLFLAIKSQSIDSLSVPDKVYKSEKEILEKAGYEIIESINIHRYAANHLVLIVQKNH
ncbi:MAG: fibrillarin-like rRNA/tRNA 2'-O-methyltransferase [Candidatus Lokiarchaeota archaeon]